MTTINRLVVLALLAVWSFPAVSFAKPEPASPPPLPAIVTSTAAPGPTEARASERAEAAQLAAREKQGQPAQDFKGGEGAYIYVGGGMVTVVLLIVLLVVLL
jgi:hypothetical protein